MNVIYQRERARDLWDEIRPLLEMHWQEIATYADLPLDPDVERYNQMDDLGVMRCYTARVDVATDLPGPHIAGKWGLIGYSVISLAPNMHYRSSKIAWQDVLFVHPKYRQSEAGRGLLLHTERELTAEGVQVVYQHQKTAHPALGVILRRMGYDHLENIWGKRLDKGD